MRLKLLLTSQERSSVIEDVSDESVQASCHNIPNFESFSFEMFD